ncbi:MAG TPA: FMN-binding protein [Streptosporangiaceae bacterium]|nr:FMN-binding protein [Streptosporangiaceae bacterium]
MKGTPLLVLAGTVAGFVGVLSFHTRPASSTALPASGAQPGGARSGHSAASPTSVPATPTAASGAVRSAMGSSVQFGYGVLSVKVTVHGTRITDVSVPAIQTAEPTSQQINAQAIPMLRSEVLSAQNARINGISGATYTSEAYVQSLQAALDKLHVK